MELEPVESGREVPHSMQGTYTLSPIEFPTDGEYALVLRYNDKDIARAVLYLQKRGEK
jgi:hypothetical protein